MTGSIDWLGLGIIVAVLAGIGYKFWIASRGRMTPSLRNAYLGIVFVVCAILLWNTLAGFP